MEEWKAVSGYEGLYEVSNLGRVRSIKRRKILSLSILKDGYCQVGLCKLGERRYFLIHRLVAEAFVPNPASKPQVNHKDEDKSNNAASNLEWMTPKENINYGTGIVRRANTQAKVLGKSVEQYDKAGKLLATFQSSQEAERQTGVGHIRECCGGRLKSAGGFVWRYAV